MYALIKKKKREKHRCWRNLLKPGVIRSWPFRVWNVSITPWGVYFVKVFKSWFQHMLSIHVPRIWSDKELGSGSRNPNPELLLVNLKICHICPWDVCLDILNFSHPALKSEFRENNQNIKNPRELIIKTSLWYTSHHITLHEPFPHLMINRKEPRHSIKNICNR